MGALERARAAYGTGAYDDATIEFLFPEVKGSEDERIREAIEGAIRVYGKTQGEWIGGYDMDTLVVHLREAFDALEKQKEQKPAEWKPLPESMEALLLAIEGKWDAIKPTGYMSRRLEDLYDGLVNTFDVDEKYLSNLPKTEYTEKDIEEIKALKEKIDSSMETKPAEWSEEDEKAAYFINQFLEYHEASDPTAKSCKEWFNNRLKSLHPDSYKNCNSRWKPSEEQMRALNEIINTLAVSKHPHESDYLFNVLNGLRKNLEKL